MIEKTILEKFGQRFHDLNVSIHRMVCLELLLSKERQATDLISDMIEDLNQSEIKALFGLEALLLEDGAEGNWPEIILEQRRGWLVYAHVAVPRNIYFDEKTGRVNGYSSGFGIYRPILVYADSLVGALEKSADQATQVREQIFDRARREQGIPERSICGPKSSLS